MARRRLDDKRDYRRFAFDSLHAGATKIGTERAMIAQWPEVEKRTLRAVLNDEWSRRRVITEAFVEHAGQWVSLAGILKCPRGTQEVKAGLDILFEDQGRKRGRRITREVIIPARGRANQLARLANELAIQETTSFLDDYPDAASRLGRRVSEARIHYLECL